jgi:hypothetical protein
MGTPNPSTIAHSTSPRAKRNRYLDIDIANVDCWFDHVFELVEERRLACGNNYRAGDDL